MNSFLFSHHEFTSTQSPPLPALLRSAAEGESRLLVQFGGQGAGFLSEIQRLYHEREGMRDFFEVGIDAVGDAARRADVLESPYYEHGFELRRWLRGEQLPPTAYLQHCNISFPLTILAQLAHVYALERMGLPLAQFIRELDDDASMVTGHSQGIFAAAAFGLGHSGDAFLQAVYDFTHWFAIAGFYVMNHYPRSAPAVPEALDSACRESCGDAPTPMVSVMGLEQDRLEAWLALVNNQLRESYGAAAVGHGLQASLCNLENAWIVTGHSLYTAEFFLAKPPAGFECSRSFLPVSAPFHRADLLEFVYREMIDDSVLLDFPYRGSDLKIRSLSCLDGSDLRESNELSLHCARIMLMGSVHWPRVLREFADYDERPGTVLDFGPGRVSAALTRQSLNVGTQDWPVVSASSRAGLRSLMAD